MSNILSAIITGGHLWLSLDDGGIVDAGQVVGPSGPKGDQGIPGAVGPAGKDGRTILSGQGLPNPEEGQDGDFYMNVRDWVIYGPKAGFNWGPGQPILPDTSSLDAAIRTFNGGGGGGGRFFGMGAPSIGIAASPGGGAGTLQPILNNDQPLAASTSQLVALDATGDAMVVDLWAQAAQGTLFVEVAVSKGNGTDTGYSSVYEVQMGTAPPVLTFTPSVSATGALQLAVSSNLALTTLRGRILLL